jgi:hypothetical protein
MLLDALGARVAGYALEPPTQPSLFELAKVEELIDSQIGDVRDLDTLAARVRTFAPEFIFHMAAQSVVLRSYDDPVEILTNVSAAASGGCPAHKPARDQRHGDKCCENGGSVIRNRLWAAAIPTPIARGA